MLCTVPAPTGQLSYNAVSYLSTLVSSSTRHLLSMLLHLRIHCLNSSPLPCFGTVAYIPDANRTQVRMNCTRDYLFKWTQVRINEPCTLRSVHKICIFHKKIAPKSYIYKISKNVIAYIIFKTSFWVILSKLSLYIKGEFYCILNDMICSYYIMQTHYI